MDLLLIQVVALQQAVAPVMLPTDLIIAVAVVVIRVPAAAVVAPIQTLAAAQSAIHKAQAAITTEALPSGAAMAEHLPAPGELNQATALRVPVLVAMVIAS